MKTSYIFIAEKKGFLMTESETHLTRCCCNRLNVFFFCHFCHKNIIYGKRINALFWYLGIFCPCCDCCCCYYVVYILVFFGFCMWSVFLFRPRECRQGLSRSIPPQIPRTQRTFQILYAPTIAPNIGSNNNYNNNNNRNNDNSDALAGAA